jgi:hypothetical protein
MWLAYRLEIGLGRINFNLASFCCAKNMATNEVLSRLEANAVTAENTIKKLKCEVFIPVQF